MLVSFGVHDLGTIEQVNTTTRAVHVQAHEFTLQVKVSGLLDSDSAPGVTIRVEGSLDDQDWFNLDAGDQDIQLTANDVYGFALSTCPVKYLRLALVGKSAASASTAKVHVQVGAV